MHAMKIIWKKKVIKIIFLLCFIAIVPYVLIVSLEKNEGKAEKKGSLFLSLNSNGRRKYHNQRAFDNLPWYGATKLPLSNTGESDSPHNVPMMVKYCNPASKLMKGEEGKTPNGYHLKGVHVFIRHGDRTSIHKIHGYDPGEYSCKFDSWYNGTDPKIRSFVPTLTQFVGKQPGKSHFLNWALYPNKDHCYNSDLTSIGALQHIRSGQHFQQRYITNNSMLFNPKIALSSQIYVRSTEVARTYQSAVAFLYGFVPKFNIAHLNIDNSRNLFFCSQKYSFKDDCFCSHAKDLSYLNKMSKKDLTSNRTSYIKLKATLADVFDSTVEQLPWMSAILDAFAPALCHNSGTPCSIWNPEKCLTSEILTQMWTEAIAVDHAQVTDPNNFYMRYSSIMLHPILVEIVARMQDLVQGRQRERFVLYSGHDLTLSPLLMILGLYDGVWPPLASRFVIELLVVKRQSNSNLSKSHYLKFIYNGDDMTDDVVFCKRKISNGLCPFDSFREFVYRQMLQRFNYKSYKDACETENTQKR